MNTPDSALRPHRDGVFWLLIAAGFTYGAVYNFLPVTFPALRYEFQTTLEQLGRTQFVFLISSLLVTFSAGWLVRQVGLRRAAAISLSLLAFGLVVIGAASSFAMVIAGCFVFGAGVASLIVAASSWITIHFVNQRQSVFFAFGVADAVGAIAGPALLGQWIGRPGGSLGSWRSGYWAAAVIVCLLAAWTLRIGGRASQPTAPSHGEFRAFVGVLRSPAIYLIGTAMFLHGVAQVGMTSWIGEFFHEMHGIGPAEAAWFLSVNSAGFLVGRSLLGAFTAHYRIPELLILAICALGGTMAFAMTLRVSSLYSGLILFGVAGLFISGDAPSMNSFVGRSWPTNTATAFAILSGIGNIGGAAGPYVTGLIGASFGIEKGIRIMPAFSLALGLLSIGWYVASRRPAMLLTRTKSTE